MKLNEKSNKKTAFNYALTLLSKQDYSESKLKKKLLNKDYEEEEILEATTRLKELGYLNDAEVVSYKFKYLFEESKKSVREIERKLTEQGFKREDIEAAREAVGEEIYERDLAAALNLLKSKYDKKKEPQKMRALLFRHGFPSNVCFDAVNDFVNDEDEDDL